jgi:ABC-type transport system substrate-binding protein
MNFYVIPDETTVISQLKNGVLDVSNSLSKKRFIEIKNDPLYKDEFDFFSPTLIRYYYLLINNNNPVLADPNVRRALAHLLDVDKIIENMEGGLGTRITSLVHPLKKYFNKDLEEIPYDPVIAKDLLTSSGWKDADGDGDLDKVINGVSKELSIDIYTSEQELGKYVTLLLQESAEKVGININIITKTFPALLTENVLKKDYGMTPFVSNLDPGLDDFYSSWHSDNADLGESNFSSYSDEDADKLIEGIRKTKDPLERDRLYKMLQEEVQNDMPVIFLYAPTETIIVNHRWKGYASSKRPGYMANTFTPTK